MLGSPQQSPRMISPNAIENYHQARTMAGSDLARNWSSHVDHDEVIFDELVPLCLWGDVAIV